MVVVLQYVWYWYYSTYGTGITVRMVLVLRYVWYWCYSTYGTGITVRMVLVLKYVCYCKLPSLFVRVMRKLAKTKDFRIQQKYLFAIGYFRHQACTCL